MKRIFLTLWPSREIATHIDTCVRPWVWSPSCRRYALEDLHLTMHFIGPVAEERLQDICEHLAVQFEPFTLTLDTPRQWSGGLMVLCPAIVPNGLVRLHTMLGHALERLSLPVSQREFSPHITLARSCKDMEVPTTCASINWSVSSYALAVSTGDADRRYELISRYPALKTGA